MSRPIVITQVAYHIKIRKKLSINLNYLNDPKLAIPIWIRIWLRIRIKMKVGSEFRKNTQESPHCPDSYYCRNSREKLCDLLLTSNYMRDKNMRILPELYLHINYNVQYVNKVSSTWTRFTFIKYSIYSCSVFSGLSE